MQCCCLISGTFAEMRLRSRVERIVLSSARFGDGHEPVAEFRRARILCLLVVVGTVKVTSPLPVLRTAWSVEVSAHGDPSGLYSVAWGE